MDSGGRGASLVARAHACARARRGHATLESMIARTQEGVAGEVLVEPGVPLHRRVVRQVHNTVMSATLHVRSTEYIADNNFEAELSFYRLNQEGEAGWIPPLHESHAAVSGQRSG